MTPRRLLATDLDGTLLRSDGSVSEATQAAIADLADDSRTDLVFVTGRPPMFLEGMADMTGHRGSVIAANGALVLDLSTLTPTRIHAIPTETAARVLSELTGAYAEVEVRSMLAAPDGRFDRIQSVGPDGADNHLAQLTVREVDGWRLAKMVAVVDDPQHPDEFLNGVQDLLAGLVEATHSSHRVPIVELGPIGVDKGSTLAEYAAAMGIPAAEVHAVGDMPNDLSMLRWAGNSYAVANAHHRVRAAATTELPANDADGVAELIRRLLAR
jgi:Cof subfamily protein (haloacid dehalogenase superfamily)